MKVAIDLLNLDENSGGFNTYARELIKGFYEIDNENEYLLFINSIIKDVPFIEKENFKVSRVKTPSPRFIRYWEQFYFSNPLSLKGIDIFHNPFSAPLVFAHSKMIVTLHDISPILYPEKHTFYSRAYWNFIWNFGLRRVDAIITDSVSSKNDIIDHFGVKEDKVFVIPLSCNQKFSEELSQDFVSSILNKYKINKPYILFVGTIEPRKNIQTLLKAFNLLMGTEYRNHSLVIVGRKGWLYEEIFKMVKDLQIEESVIFTGQVAEDDLPAIYQGASIFVYPSLYEGFGLPPLEAMCSGIPVIVSNTSSLLEVVGDAAITVDPLDVESIVRSIVKVLSDFQLRKNLVQKGKFRCSQFTLEKMVSSTLDVYRTVSTKK